MDVINAARQQLYLAKATAVAFGYGGFKKEARSYLIWQSWFVGYF